MASMPPKRWRAPRYGQRWRPIMQAPCGSCLRVLHIPSFRSKARLRPAQPTNLEGLSASPAPTATERWIARSRASVWHPCTQMKHHESLPLVAIERARGAWLHDFDGRRYLDAVSSWWVNLFGHAHPAINSAIVKQLEDLEHVMLAGFTHRPAVEL